MKETELGERVIEWIQEKRPKWDIYQELSLGYARKVADIVCIKNDLVWVIELKTSFTLEVIKQAWEWDVDYRTVAVPGVNSRAANDTRRFWYGIIGRKMEISTIEVKNNYISTYYLGSYGREWAQHEVNFGPENDPEGHIISHKGKLIQLANSGLTKGFSEAGSKNGGHWTPYKESMQNYIRPFIKDNPGTTTREIVEELGKMHYSSERSAKATIGKRLRTIEKKWCGVDKSSKPYRYYVKETQK